MNRIAYFDMTWPMVLSVAAGSPLRSVTSTLPADAAVSHLVLDHERQMVRVYFTSESLEPVAEGALIPKAEPVLTMHWPEP